MENGGMERVIEKVKKLLNLANHKNTTEEEATAAMGMVQDILGRYNLSMAQVHESNGKEKSTAEGKRVKEEWDKSAMDEYQQHLMNALAKNHYCIYFIGRKWVQSKSGRWMRKPYHMVIGKEANVITVKLMFEYLNGTIDRLVNIEYPPPTNLSRSAISWREGCSARLQQRLYDKRYEADHKQEEEAKQSAGNGSSSNALVLLSSIRGVEDDLNWDFHYGNEPGTQARQRAEALQEKSTIIPSNPKLSKEEQDKKEKYWQRYFEREQRKQDRKWAQKDIHAYRAGHAKGGEIGLEDQINFKSEGRKIND